MAKRGPKWGYGLNGTVEDLKAAAGGAGQCRLGRQGDAGTHGWEGPDPPEVQTVEVGPHA